MRLDLYIQPGAKKTEMSGLHDGKVKIRICAPPVEGAANKALVKFLSKTLGISQSKINIISGEKSRNKTLQIEADECVIIEKLGL